MLMKTWAVAALVLLPHSVTSAAEQAGCVVGVNDGDTLTVLRLERAPLHVRLVDLDVPGSGQPCGDRRQARPVGPCVWP